LWKPCDMLLSMMKNEFGNLDAQSPESRLAQVQSHESDPCHCNGGWPGDGSGVDDLADLMAHGDEGCCDGAGD
jgi:hypothetical protein